MSRKVIILSAITFLLAILTAAFVWVAISVLSRLNPELNIGREGYEAEVPEQKERCSADQVCLMHPETGEERVVPSSCDDQTTDVADLEAEGWQRCSAVAPDTAANWPVYNNTDVGFSLRYPPRLSTVVEDNPCTDHCVYGFLSEDRSEAVAVHIDFRDEADLTTWADQQNWRDEDPWRERFMITELQGYEAFYDSRYLRYYVLTDGRLFDITNGLGNDNKTAIPDDEFETLLSTFRFTG